MNAAARELVRVVDLARAGVIFSPRNGAVCPGCGATRLRAYKTMPWSGSVRIRYHKCGNPECILCAIGEGIKSLQEEL
ncbi:MAG: transcriptional regulator [Desulfomicrobium sp.]|nr:transcriptional regulator [Pseudomonadota bacterium]MBV1710747.1 transcriptional regulator [Desulfomicrobium sp.]MBU4570355.1 transcriptional regulator [Pseudomonadota bacterium]MBU4593276.1 transcriptional regulator [Pseudomonadota bacterium]MBV1719829.1 transcriptional regulator [Desulfomicrobium sp.]